jgi:hypothetical protein
MKVKFNFTPNALKNIKPVL